MATQALTKNGRTRPALFDRFLEPWNQWIDKESWTGRVDIPAVNIVENKDAYIVSLAAPGLKKEEFKIDIDGNMLTISSEKEEKKEEKKKKYTRQEYNYTSFSRSFAIPDEINREKIEASYEDGVLKVTMPRMGQVKNSITRNIPVK